MNVPLKVQVGAVVMLFVASLANLWSTSVSVVARERRRVSAGNVLCGAGRWRVGAGTCWRPPRAGLTTWVGASGTTWTAGSPGRRRGRGAFEGVEGGYFLRDHKRFLGASFPTEPGGPGQKKKARDRRGPHGPPPREADLIEIQADAAIRLGRDLLVVEVVDPSTVAIRTAPVVVDGRAVAATWTMTRLVDPLFLDRSVRGYRLSAGLALGGVALSLALTAGLSRTVGRQARERDRLQAELRRSERLAALGKLLAGVAHEVRNPLAGIRSTVQLWQRGIGGDAESLDDVLAEVDRLDGLVGRLLHFSRADAQALAPGDLNAVVAESARLARGAAGSQGVGVVLDLAPGLPPVAMAAPALLQVFRNLTTNALHAMPAGGVLRLSTRLDPSRRSAEASVSDTGPGLGREALAHVFEPFYTTKAGGTGLGLAIAREIALAHRGDLRAGNRAGAGGAVFTLTLPAAPAGADGAAR